MSDIFDYKIRLVRAVDTSSCEGNPDINPQYSTVHSSHPVT